MTIFCIERSLSLYRGLIAVSARLKSRLRAMIIAVSQISEDEGLSVHHLYPEGEIELRGSESRLVGPADLDLRATRSGVRVNLIGTLNAQVEFDCDRCLKPITLPVAQAFDLVYLPHPSRPREETELGADDLEVGFYQGQAIDLDDVAREQVELALPMSRLCSEYCRGLCLECGEDLNEGQCDCSTKQSDLRWAGMEKFKSDN